MTSPTPPANPTPEPRVYLWITLGALALLILTFLPFNHLPLAVNALVWAVALILAFIGALKMRRKVLPIITMLAASLFLCCIGGSSLFFMGLQAALNPPTPIPPRLEWDTTPGAVIAQAAKPIRTYLVSIPGDYTRNYIPDGRLFGDGRIVWVEYRDSGPGRSVWEGQLSQEQMTTLLQEFINQGFFGWKDRYSSLMPYENPISEYLTLNLTNAQKTVTVTMGNPPEGFYSLFVTLSTGAGAQGKPYVPTQGTLIAIPSADAADTTWDGENLNLDLSKAAEGISVEGKALQLAWDLVNSGAYKPPVVSLNGLNYTIYILIPGLMY